MSENPLGKFYRGQVNHISRRHISGGSKEGGGGCGGRSRSTNDIFDTPFNPSLHKHSKIRFLSRKVI